MEIMESAAGKQTAKRPTRNCQLQLIEFAEREVKGGGVAAGRKSSSTKLIPFLRIISYGSEKKEVALRAIICQIQ